MYPAYAASKLYFVDTNFHVSSVILHSSLFDYHPNLGQPVLEFWNVECQVVDKSRGV